MEDPSNKEIQEMKDLMEKESGKTVTWEEATKGADAIARLAEIMFDQVLIEQKRQKQLEEFPQGFVLEGVGYSCFICGNSTREGANWYDKYGIKCNMCQDSINRKEIPASLAKNRESWYSKHDMESRFNVRGPVLRSWIKKGIIKVRTLTYGGRSHLQVFLIKDNEDFLPPKVLTEHKTVSEEKDGKRWFSIEPWYRFGNPHELLKDYKIMDHLKITNEKEEV